MVDSSVALQWQQILDNPLFWLIILIAVLLGASLIWFFTRKRLNEQVQIIDSQRVDHVRVATELEQVQRSLEREHDNEVHLQQTLEDKSKLILTLNTRQAGLLARLESERNNNQQQLQRLEQAEERLSNTFKRLANDVFEQKQKTFNEQSQQQMQHLLTPLQTQMQNFSQLVQSTNDKNAQQHGNLQQQLLDLKSLNQNLSSEAAQLTDALRGSNKMLGNWGEQQLEKLLQLAGLQKDREYRREVTIRNEEGKSLRPDALILLPDNKCIVIDAKVSLEHYTRAHNAETVSERENYLKQHCQSIHQHINGLANKGYAHVAELDSPNFVLMFVPVEAALLEALRFDSSLLDYAITKNIAMVTPTNLLSTLRTVSSVWQAWRQNENAREIGERAGKLYDKFYGFVTDLENVGQRINQVSKAYDDAFGKLSIGPGNLLRQVQMLQDLGAKTSKQLDAKYLTEQEEKNTESITTEEQQNVPLLPGESRE